MRSRPTNKRNSWRDVLNIRACHLKKIQVQLQLPVERTGISNSITKSTSSVVNTLRKANKTKIYFEANCIESQ